jgi:hypothetical protein
MLRRSLPCLLILLLSSADLDDAWAIATPDPSDDAQAADNNEYLNLTRCVGERLPGPDQSPADCPAVPPAGHGPLPPPFPVPPAPRPAATGSLLYLLMSLQR